MILLVTSTYFYYVLAFAGFFKQNVRRHLHCRPLIQKCWGTQSPIPGRGQYNAYGKAVRTKSHRNDKHFFGLIGRPPFLFTGLPG